MREAAAKYGAVEAASSDLKNDWHHWLDQVARGRRTIVVTRYGKPIATLALVSESDEAGTEFFAALRGWVVDETDLITPLEEDWDAAR